MDARHTLQDGTQWWHNYRVEAPRSFFSLVDLLVGNVSCGEGAAGKFATGDHLIKGAVTYRHGKAEKKVGKRILLNNQRQENSRRLLVTRSPS